MSYAAARRIIKKYKVASRNVHLDGSLYTNIFVGFMTYGTKTLEVWIGEFSMPRRPSDEYLSRFIKESERNNGIMQNLRKFTNRAGVITSDRIEFDIYLQILGNLR